MKSIQSLSTMAAATSLAAWLMSPSPTAAFNMPSLDERPSDSATHKCKGQAYHLLILQPHVASDSADATAPPLESREDLGSALEAPICHTVYRRADINCVPSSEFQADTKPQAEATTDYRMRAVYAVGGPTGRCVTHRS